MLHQVVTAQLAGRRTGTHDTKTRGEVRGGGKKPYRQKGTGRARQGTRSAPHYRGGGVVFGPHPRSYEQRLPRKMKRLALRGALTAKFGDERDPGHRHVRPRRHPRPRSSSACLGALEATGRVLVVAPGARRERSSCRPATCRRVEIILADSLNVVDLLNADVVLIEQPSLARDAGGVRMSVLTAPEIILRPVISEKSIDESEPRQVHVRGPRRRQQDPDQGRRSRSSTRRRT